jgi:hypothetical protein
MQPSTRTLDETGLEEISQVLVAILDELREANRREKERDEKRETETASAHRRYAGL